MFKTFWFSPCTWTCWTYRRTSCTGGTIESRTHRKNLQPRRTEHLQCTKGQRKKERESERLKIHFWRDIGRSYTYVRYGQKCSSIFANSK